MSYRGVYVCAKWKKPQLSEVNLLRWQEHRMAGVGRDLKRSSSSMLLLQQDQLELVVQYTVVRFWVPPQLENSQPLCPTYSSVWPPPQLSAPLCSDGVSHVSVCPHCLCPVSGNMQPEPDERSVNSHCEFWIHGNLHGHSNQPNEDTCAVTIHLRGTVFFPSFLSTPFQYPVQFNRKA